MTITDGCLPYPCSRRQTGSAEGLEWRTGAAAENAATPHAMIACGVALIP